ncbi:TetR/AcrR family transcriptional regulator [Actinocorallia libanotica]|uniref:TetR/AcrR family transcriptional regulator C-terminal domain-containing protein n=1 Tax=Actinocorallia libanotica TaxID=46162 RepID=A0ABN1RUQ0_9ACTN
MPRPRSLTPSRIADAALAVLDAEGHGALSMRAVAARLGMGTMSLYRYVEDRSALEELVVERILEPVDLTAPDGAWRHRLLELSERVRRAVAAHPAAIPLAIAHRQSSPTLLRWTETVLDVLTAAGLTGHARAAALRALLAHLIGALELAHGAPLQGEGTRRLSALPPADFPLLTATARDAAAISPEEEFRLGLELLLNGLAAAHLGETPETGEK